MGKGRFHETVEITVQHIARRGRFRARAQVFHKLIGLQHIGPDLVAPADIGLAVKGGVGGVFALLHFQIIEPRAQRLHGVGAVLVLGFFRGRHHNARREVRDAHRRVGRVDVLAARARRPVGVDADVLVLNVDLDIVINHRIDANR